MTQRAPIATLPLPSVSVVVRSYNRYPHLVRLLESLEGQDHPDYEVVVIEQSQLLPEQRAFLDGLAANNPRLRLLYSPPLGLGGSREAGWRAATKEIVLTIDDDDLPLGKSYVSGHAKNYLDSTIVAVTGRHVYSPDERCGYHNRERALRRCLRYNWFGYPHAYCRLDERIESVDWVHGTGGSVRLSLIRRLGGWDARSTEHDEHPFCLALRRHLRAGERLVFDPTVLLLRTKDVPGGAGVRFGGAGRVFRMWIRYYHGLVMKHRPVVSVLCYPLLVVAACYSVFRYIWHDSKVHHTRSERWLDTVRTSVLLPVWYARELWERFTGESSRYPD
ncbi:MAG: glycosyltransferase family 2 protein [Polyangiaceae bacterium]|nr:glycosyltransferase family 2 protein [Polyangiaceae bacterium]